VKNDCAQKERAGERGISAGDGEGESAGVVARQRQTGGERHETAAALAAHSPCTKRSHTWQRRALSLSRLLLLRRLSGAQRPWDGYGKREYVNGGAMKRRRYDIVSGHRQVVTWLKNMTAGGK